MSSLNVKIDGNDYIIEAKKPLPDANPGVGIVEILSDQNKKIDNIESDISTNNSAVSDLRDGLSTEINRANAAEDSLQNNINTEISRAESAEKILQDNINAEENRAIAAENSLQINISDETTRAAAVENSLQTQINNEAINRQQEIADVISAEAADRQGQINELFDDKLDKTGNASNTTNAFTEAATRTNLSTGEKISLSLGKIMKWFADLKAMAFKDTVSKADLDVSLQNEINAKGSGSGTITGITGNNGLTGSGTTGNVTIGMANMETNRIKGRITSSAGVPEDLTAAQVKTMLGIDKVDNTSDMEKPISTATQSALNEITTNGLLSASAYGTCGTAAETALKDVTLANFVKRTGAIVGVRFAAVNTATNPTLRINSSVAGDAANIRYDNANITADMIASTTLVFWFQFDGTYWQLINPAIIDGGTF